MSNMPDNPAPPVIARVDIEQLGRDGYCVLRGVVASDVIEACTDRLLRWLRDAIDIDSTDPASYQHLGTYQWIGFHSGDPFDQLFSPAVADALDTLLGPGRYEPPSKHGYFWASLPRGNPDPWVAPRYFGRWHIDHGRHPVSAFDLRCGSCALVPIWLLSDVYPGGGATCGFRGSHRAVARHLARMGAVPAQQFDAFTEAYAMNHMDDLVELTGRAGDLVLAHPFFVHGASGNASDRARLICNTGLALRGSRRLTPEDGELSIIETIIAESIADIPAVPPAPWLMRLYRLQDRLQEWRATAGRFDTRRVWDAPPAGVLGLVFWSATMGARACGRLIESTDTQLGQLIKRRDESK